MESICSFICIYLAVNLYLSQINSFHSLWLRANARNVSFETLYDGQFTLSTQLITPNYLVIISHRRKTSLCYKEISTKTETLKNCDGQFTVSTQLIIPNYLISILIKNRPEDSLISIRLSFRGEELIESWPSNVRNRHVSIFTIFQMNFIGAWMKIEDKERKEIWQSKEESSWQISKLFYADCIEFYTLYPSKVYKTRISF